MAEVVELACASCNGPVVYRPGGRGPDGEMRWGWVHAERGDCDAVGRPVRKRAAG